MKRKLTWQKVVFAIFWGLAWGGMWMALLLKL